MGEIFLQEFLLFAGQLTSCSVFLADALGTTWSPRPDIFELFHRPTVIRAGSSTQFFTRSRAGFATRRRLGTSPGLRGLSRLSNKLLTQLLNTWTKLAREAW